MFGKPKAFFFIGVLVAIAGCARPTYINDSNGNGGPQNKLGDDCQAKFREAGYCVHFTWVKKPTETEKGEFIFHVFQYDETHFPVSVNLPAAPEVVLWMPSMGHGSSPVTVAPTETGSYRASGVFFIMPGVWQIKFQMKDADKVSDEAVLDYVF